jgi:hypothetical protein
MEKLDSVAISPYAYVSWFYYWFRCCVRRQFIDKPFYKYYNILFNYVYTTDGKYFVGIYTPNMVYPIETYVPDKDPDRIYCFPCWLFTYLYEGYTLYVSQKQKRQQNIMR